MTPEALKQNDNYETGKMRPAVHLPLQQVSLPTVPLPDLQRRPRKAFPYIKINVFAIRNDSLARLLLHVRSDHRSGSLKPSF